MKYKTCELEGAQLNAAVAKALGLRFELKHFRGDGSHPIDKCLLVIDLVSGGTRTETFKPSTDWACGGPIIERELISIVASMNVDMAGPLEWSATVGAFEHYIDEGLPLGGYDDKSGAGTTPLVAAMRAFVFDKMGTEVDL